MQGYNPLHLACFGGHIAVVGLLLSRAADLLPSQDKHGKTGLHIAAMNGHYAMVEVLLGQGSEIDATDRVCDSFATMRVILSGLILTERLDSAALLGARWLLRRRAASHRQRRVAQSGDQLRQRPNLVCSVRRSL